MEPSAMDSIAARLSTVENLYFPGSIHSPGPPPPSRLKSLLLDLLSRDPPLFLERYGSHLTPPELRPFETLAPRTYELDFHLSRLKTSRAPPAAATVKNRRRAYLDRLVGAGDYFSEEAMREREPWLHYDLVGRFQDPAGRGMARPGERWSETLMRRWEEAEMVEKIREEQKRLGVEKKDWIGGEVEVVEEEEEEQMEEVETETESEGETDDDDDDHMGVGPSELPKV